MEDQREALGGGEGVEDDEQGEADRVGEEGLVLGVEAALGVDHRVGQADVQGLFAAPGAGAEQVQADAGGDGGEPAGEVRDVVGVGAFGAEPGLLERIVGFAEGAEHAVGEGAQARALRFEARREGGGLAHRRGAPSLRRPCRSGPDRLRA